MQKRWDCCSASCWQQKKQSNIRHLVTKLNKKKYEYLDEQGRIHSWLLKVPTPVPNKWTTLWLLPTQKECKDLWECPGNCSFAWNLFFFSIVCSYSFLQSLQLNQSHKPILCTTNQYNSCRNIFSIQTE